MNEPLYKSQIYPSFFRLILMFIGSLDTIFGIIILIVSLQKSIFSISLYFFILLSLAGGISLLIVAKQDMNKTNIILRMGFGVGLILSFVYLYFIIQTLLQG